MLRRVLCEQLSLPFAFHFFFPIILCYAEKPSELRFKFPSRSYVASSLLRNETSSQLCIVSSHYSVLQAFCKTSGLQFTTFWRHSVSPPQPAKSALLLGWFLPSCGAGSAVSSNIETLTPLTFETFSSGSPAPFLRPTTPHNLVAPTFLSLSVLSHHYHPALRTSG